jgi:hypothetical protein
MTGCQMASYIMIWLHMHKDHSLLWPTPMYANAYDTPYATTHALLEGVCKHCLSNTNTMCQLHRSNRYN